MKFIDMHCDTLALAASRGETTMYELTNSMLDVRRLKAAGALAQFFAVFFPPREAFGRMGIGAADDAEYFARCHSVFTATLKEHSDVIKPAYNAGDIGDNEAAGAVSALLTFEDGRAIDGKLENLAHYHDLGVRLISLTWNGENCFGWPNSPDPELMARGLKPFGVEAVYEMNRLGMIIDVSHLSDGGFWDVSRHSEKPFVASHSNARALSPHRRNLTDDMIRALAERGGVVGVNYYPLFLNADASPSPATAELAARHVVHIIKAGGEDTAALGSDWDGFKEETELDGPQKTELLFAALRSAGISERLIEKVAWTNALRVLGDVLG
ncbi:MAG: dipeptidase [Oscillospiraceae bacterium]|nr:dipeptidase [Oscillospiraceae bacterium]